MRRDLFARREAGGLGLVVGIALSVIGAILGMAWQVILVLTVLRVWGWL